MGHGSSKHYEKLTLPGVGEGTHCWQHWPRWLLIAKQVQPRSQDIVTGNSLGSEPGLQPSGKEILEDSIFHCRINVSHSDSLDACPHHHSSDSN
jgi:hypothetical protein